MLFIEYTAEQLRAFLAQIAVINSADFPYDHSRAALSEIHDFFESNVSLLKESEASTDAAIARQTCKEIQQNLEEYIDIIGFIFRSTNIRNAFEFHAPILELARNVLGNDTKLVLSSEWDSSPFTYKPFTTPPEFVFIGLPAFLSATAFILPVAGHEIGHHIWEELGLKSEFFPQIQGELKVLAIKKKALINQINPELNKEIEQIEDVKVFDNLKLSALKKCEEIFSDFVGLRIFGESFLHTCHYLLASNVEPILDHDFPPLEQRAKTLGEVAKQMLGLAPIQDFFDDLSNNAPMTDLKEDSKLSEDYLIQDLTNEVAESLANELLVYAKNSLNEKNIPLPDDIEAERIYNQFKKIVPATNCNNFADIISAGWRARLDPKLWHDVDYKQNRKLAILNDLVLKTIEVWEFETKTKV